MAWVSGPFTTGSGGKQEVRVSRGVFLVNKKILTDTEGERRGDTPLINSKFINWKESQSIKHTEDTCTHVSFIHRKKRTIIQITVT